MEGLGLELGSQARLAAFRRIRLVHLQLVDLRSRTAARHRLSCADDVVPVAQYNTCYWALVQSGKTAQEAQAALKVRRAIHARTATCLLPGFTCLQPFQTGLLLRRARGQFSHIVLCRGR